MSRGLIEFSLIFLSLSPLFFFLLYISPLSLRQLFSPRKKNIDESLTSLRDCVRVRVCVFLTSTTTGFFITYILSLSILLSFLLLLLAYLFPLGPFQLLPLSSSFLSSESWLLLLLLLSLSRSRQLCSCFQFYGPALTPVRQGSVTGKENKKKFRSVSTTPTLALFRHAPQNASLGPVRLPMESYFFLL